jgi:hypothetical protein
METGSIGEVMDHPEGRVNDGVNSRLIFPLCSTEYKRETVELGLSFEYEDSR